MRHLLFLALAAFVMSGCGGSGTTDAAALSVQGELAKTTYNEIRAEFDAGNGADQNLACVFLLDIIEGNAVTEADKAVLADSKKLCYGEIHKAMFDKTVADIEARGEDTTLPPFMECVPAQTALDEAAKEVDVPGLVESKAKAQELCAAAWAE